jgi:hypothetical protein
MAYCNNNNNKQRRRVDLVHVIPRHNCSGRNKIFIMRRRRRPRRGKKYEKTVDGKVKNLNIYAPRWQGKMRYFGTRRISPPPRMPPRGGGAGAKASMEKKWRRRGPVMMPNRRCKIYKPNMKMDFYIIYGGV